MNGRNSLRRWVVDSVTQDSETHRSVAFVVFVVTL